MGEGAAVHRSLWKRIWHDDIPPGIWIAVLGVYAVIATLLLPPNPDAWKTASIVLGAFGLMFLEVKAIYRDRDKAAADHARELTKDRGDAEARFSQTLERFERLEQSRITKEGVREEIREAKIAGADPSGLRLEALTLADEIAGFLEKRISEWVPSDDWVPQTNMWQQIGPQLGIQGPFRAHDIETCNLYWEEFGKRVRALRDKFSNVADLRDAELDRAYPEMPTGNRSIYMVINGLRRLAERLGEK